jgi:hypothetical protein
MWNFYFSTYSRTFLSQPFCPLSIAFHSCIPVITFHFLLGNSILYPRHSICLELSYSAQGVLFPLLGIPLSTQLTLPSSTQGNSTGQKGHSHSLPRTFHPFLRAFYSTPRLFHFLCAAFHTLLKGFHTLSRACHSIPTAFHFHPKHCIMFLQHFILYPRCSTIDLELCFLHIGNSIPYLENFHLR